MKFPTRFQSFPSFWRRWAPRRDSQAARAWRRPRRILRCEVRGPSPGRRIKEKLTRGQWWIATESQQIDKNLGIRWKTDSPGFNFCSWGPGFGGKRRAEYGEAHLFIVDGPIAVLYPWLGIQLPILQFILVLSWYPIHSYIGWQAFGMVEDKLWG